MTVSGVFSAPELQRAIALVEAIIRSLGIDPAATRSDRDTHVAFALRRGSARILVGVHAPSAELAEGRLRVVAPVVRLPGGEKDAALMRRVLEANATELVGAAFAISGSDVVVVSERPVVDLDASEVEAMIRNVGRVADRYDDELAATYGALRASDR